MRLIVLRSLVTGIIICGVYTETGIWTTINFVLIFIGLEIINSMLKGKRL